MGPSYTVGYPAAWNAYEGYVESLPGKPWKSELHLSMSRFGGRYRAASCMHIRFDEDTNAFRGYADLIQVAMSYSALEALERGLKRDSRIAELRGKRAKSKYLDRQIVSEELTGLFRSRQATKLRRAVQIHLNDEGLKTKLLTLASRGSDIKPLVKGVRHLTFHGLVAPSSIAYGWSPEGTVETLLRGLRSETLYATDALFSKWVMDFCQPEGALF